MRNLRSGATGWFLPIALLALAACEEHPEIEIAKIRENGAPVRVGATTEERFRLERRKKRKTNEEIVAEMLEWKVPEGFEQLPSRSLRIVNLRRGEVQCYVTFLSGGTAAGNINRWRSQMGLPPVSEAEIEKLRDGQLLERDAHRLDVTGTWSARGERKPDQRLVAKYAQYPRFAMSVKMVGPKDAVATAIAGFDAFCESLTWKSDFGKQAGEEPGSGAHGEAAKLAWDVPEGWQQGEAKASSWASRHASFDTPGGASSWITFLGPAAGSWSDNVARWVGQVGNSPLDGKALAALPRVTVLGKDVPMLVTYGETEGLLAVMASLPGRTMFVKLQGPKDAVKAQEGNFRAFCKSLRFEK